MHWETVSGNLRTVLQDLMGVSALEDFFLVGGTALALHLGHRISVDVDVFTLEAFDTEDLAETLRREMEMEEVETGRNTVRGLIRGIKVDVIAHRYPLLGPVEEAEGIRMASLPDLAAMKCNALANRGSKKDFWDVAALLGRFSFQEILGFAEARYPGDSVWNIRKSFLYFDDAEQEPDPKTLWPVSWDQVKQTLTRHATLRLEP